MDEIRKTGRVTIPTDLDVVPETLPIKYFDTHPQDVYKRQATVRKSVSLPTCCKQMVSSTKS